AVWPTFGFPWQDRRVQAPDLSVVILPPAAPASEPVVTRDEQPLQQSVPAERPRTPEALSVVPAASSRAATSAVADKLDHKVKEHSGTATATQISPAPASAPIAAPVLAAVPAPASSSADQPGDVTAPTIDAPTVIAVERTEEETWVLPSTLAGAAGPGMAAAPSIAIADRAETSSRDEAPRQEPAPTQDRAANTQLAQDLATAEAELKETERKETERKETERKETERKETERKETERKETERKETERKETERKEIERKE